MTTNNQDQQWKIVRGPSREELFDGLRLRHEDRKILFHLEGSRDTLLQEEEILNVKINGIRIEGGSGNNWLLQLSPDRFLIFGQGVGFDACYNTARRKGWVRLASK